MCFRIPGQSCNAPTRMLVPAAKIGRGGGDRQAGRRVGGHRRSFFREKPIWDPSSRRCNSSGFRAISPKAIAEGAKSGHRRLGDAPTDWRRATSSSRPYSPTCAMNMTIARARRSSGPVLCILPYDNEEQAIQIANDTPYGLAAYVWSKDKPARARRGWRSDPRGPGHLERRLRQHETRPSAASRCPATAASGASSACATSWRVKAVIGVDAA